MTKVRTYRIDVDEYAREWDAVVIGTCWWMTSQHLWTAASFDAGCCAGNIPVIDSCWRLPDSTVPSAAMKKCVYDPTNKNADAFDYCNFTNTPTIPDVYDPIITFTQGWITKWSISLNQPWTSTIALDAGWVQAWKGININNNFVEVNYDDNTIKLQDNNKIYVNVDNELNCSSELPVQNKIIKWAIDWLSCDINTVDCKFADYTKTCDLSCVAFTNEYCDLNNKPYIPDVIDNLTCNATNKSLSANQGSLLKWMIDDLKAIGKFLSLWDSTTWLPVSFPQSIPYTYSTGDYYLVENVWTTNYKPVWSLYNWIASSTIETWEVEIWDMYIYDGTTWLLQINHWKSVSFANLTWQPDDNANLCAALSAKTDDSTLCAVSKSWQYCDLTWTPTIPTVNNNTITLQKNGTAVDYFTLNQSSDKCINITVPTTVWELSDSSCYATVASLCDVATSAQYCDLIGTPTIPAALSAGNGINITSNCINVNYDWSTIKKNNWNCLYADLTWYVQSCDLSCVAFSNEYCDLTWTPTLCDVATSAQYCDLIGTPTIPTDNCQLLNGCWYTTCTGTLVASDLNWYAQTCNLATVATSWCYCDLIWAPIAPDVNTQAFYLSSTSDITNATAALTYINNWWYAIVVLNNVAYSLSSKSSSSLVFKWPASFTANTSDTTINVPTLTFTVSSSAVTAITSSNTSLWQYLQTDRNYSTAYTPAYNWSPATKKYVDDCIWWISIPTDNCQLSNGCWYTTCTGTLTDNSLKTVNGCSLVWNWDICIQSGTWWQINGTLSCQTDLNTALGWKLDKVTDTNTYWRVYGISTTWEQVTVCISPGLVNNTLVRRSWNQIIVPDTPTATCHAASKCYVDTAIAGVGWWDMCYSDFNWTSKSWASVTLSLNSTLTPSANFTVNKPSTIKEWQVYVLRVTNGATPYTMTLGTGITNPWWVDLTLTPSGTDQFTFLATSSSALELQAMWERENVFVTQAQYDALPSTKNADWKTYFIYEE